MSRVENIELQKYFEWTLINFYIDDTVYKLWIEKKKLHRQKKPDNCKKKC